jgi:6-phosphogluconolactonase
MEPEYIITPDPVALAHKAAQIFAASAVEGVEARARFSAALSGGSTPRALYGLLAQDPYRKQIPWSGIHLFWGDERSVPPDDRDSNYLLAHEALIAHVPIPPANVHRIFGELEPKAAARVYDRELQDFFCGPHARFDLVLLGLGEDGHTASLFPGSRILDEKEGLVAEATALYQDRPAQRVTLTPRAINTARHILFLVSGSTKARIVQAVLEGSKGQYPAQWIQPAAGQLTWLMDEAAASLLSRSRLAAQEDIG